MNNLHLRLLEAEDAESLLDLKLRNREFYQTFDPIRDEAHYTLEGQRQEIINGRQAANNDQNYFYGVFLQERLVGRIALTGIVRGPFQNAYLGYYIDQQHNGKGYATAAVSLCLNIAFNELSLHRVEAGVMPKNLPSRRVLIKSGFDSIGVAKSYLKINGEWENHEIFAKLAE